tara:strand:+ start:1737 stop:2126 length:390 start_codon:yes stop_codon:yes gene_type:complete
MFEQAVVYLSSAILAIMIFFSFIVAPVTFTSLDEDNARKFIRKIFPYYYNVNLFLSIILTLVFIILKSYQLNFYLIFCVTVLFVISNYVLMPLINKYRDEKQEKKFKYSHMLSVIINFLQIGLLLIIII